MLEGSRAADPVHPLLYLAAAVTVGEGHHALVVGKRLKEERSGSGATAGMGESERHRRCGGEGGAALWEAARGIGRGADVGRGRGATGIAVGAEREEFRVWEAGCAYIHVLLIQRF